MTPVEQTMPPRFDKRWSDNHLLEEFRRAYSWEITAISGKQARAWTKYGEQCRHEIMRRMARRQPQELRA